MTGGVQMSERIHVQGMILSSMAIGESDKRVTILTTACGKISAFARGAKRPGSSLMAATEPFAFGEFELIEGRSSHTMVSAHITEYFEALRTDMTAACYGFYFLEFADYYGRENNDDLEMLKLLYHTVRALCKKQIPLRLIRCIYELRLMTINGEGPNTGACISCGKEEDTFYFSVRRSAALCSECVKKADAGAVLLGPAAAYALRFIVSAPLGKLYSFTVSDAVLDTLSEVIHQYVDRYVDRRFKSLEILSVMEAMPS